MPGAAPSTETITSFDMDAMVRTQQGLAEVPLLRLSVPVQAALPPCSFPGFRYTTAIFPEGVFWHMGGPQVAAGT